VSWDGCLGDGGSGCGLELSPSQRGNLVGPGIAVLLLLLAASSGGGAAFVYYVIRAHAAYWRSGGSPLGSSWWST
jgi:hypothetical protein